MKQIILTKIYTRLFTDPYGAEYGFWEMKVISKPATILLPCVPDSFRDKLYSPAISICKNFNLYDDMIEDYYEYSTIYSGREYYIKELEHMLSDSSRDTKPKFVRVYERRLEVV